MTIPEQNPPPETSKAKNDAGGGGFFSRIRESAIDNYNGLYRIVLKPRMPEGILYGIGILAVLFGIFWAYVVAPVDWSRCTEKITSKNGHPKQAPFLCACVLWHLKGREKHRNSLEPKRAIPSLHPTSQMRAFFKAVCTDGFAPEELLDQIGIFNRTDSGVLCFVTRLDHDRMPDRFGRFDAQRDVFRPVFAELR